MNFTRNLTYVSKLKVSEDDHKDIVVISQKGRQSPYPSFQIRLNLTQIEYFYNIS